MFSVAETKITIVQHDKQLISVKDSGAEYFQCSRMKETMTYIVLVLLAVAGCVASAALGSMGENGKQDSVGEALDNGLSDLIRSISSIHDHVRNISGTQLGTFSAAVDREIATGINAVTKDVTIDNLMDKIQLARNKIKEIRAKVGGTMDDLEKNWPEAKIKKQQP